MPFPQRIGPTPLTTTASTLITIPQPTRWTDLFVANRSGAPVTVSIWLLAAGETASDDNLIIPTVNLPASDVIVYRFNIPLAMGDRLVGQGNTAGLNVILTLSDEKN